MLEFDLSPLIGAHPGERLTFYLDEGPRQWNDITTDFLLGTFHFTRVQKGILVQGKINTQVQSECVRCLKPFSLKMTLEVEEIIGLTKQPDPDTPYHITEEGLFNASSLLREQTWVALPIKPLCAPECPGFCPQCGADLSVTTCDCHQGEINPHFATLASLLDEQE
jgi:uncharacterized protein